MVEQEIRQRATTEVPQRAAAVTWGQQFCTLVGRDFKNTVRNPLLTVIRLAQTVFVGLYGRGVFARFSGDYLDQNNWRAVTGFLFFFSINMLVSAMIPVELVFPRERVVFVKEEGSRLYGTLAYWASRNAVELPYTVVFPLIQVLVLYWLVGLSNTA